MKLIVGLGNPGKEYENTRHNVGFLVVEEIAKRIGGNWKFEKKWKAEIAEGTIDGERIAFMKPQTFMNLSGDAVQPAISFWKLTPRDVIVVFDDADMGFGQVRARNEGSSGGHNGMQSVIERLGTDAIARVKIGIGRSDNPNVPLEDWVLNAWTAEEMEQLAGIISQAADRVIELL